MLKRLGLVKKWINWIKGCMESSSVSILINGSPTKEFSPSRGLRQGDPLAPFFFLIVVEGLAGLVRRVVSLNRLHRLLIEANHVVVTLFQFANDTLVVCQASHQDVMTVKTILRYFELASGLKMNFHKSKIGAVGVKRQHLLVFVDVLNCAHMSVSFKYLGLQVGGNPRKREF